MLRHLASTATDEETGETAQLSVLGSKTFTILHSEESITRQIRVAEGKIGLFGNEALQQGMRAYISDLRYF